MKSLGIDQSYTHTGMVLLDNSKLEYFNIISSDKNDDIFYRSWWIANTISDIVLSLNPDYVTIEGLSFGSRGNQTRNLSGLQFSIINKLRFDNKFIVHIVAPPTLKKFATGNGKCDKNLMISSLPENVLTSFKEENYKKSTGLTDLADAYWLAKWRVE